MELVLAITKALADQNRLRVLVALRQQPELCSCQLADLLRITTASVSRHMSLLQACGLVRGRKEGRWVHYRLADAAQQTPLRQILDWIAQGCANDPLFQEDSHRLAGKLIPCNRKEA